MIKRFILLSLLLATFINSDLSSQSRVQIKNSFYDAESWILFEDYKEALPLYQQLLKLYPTNSNYKYRIGQCYLNTPGEKAKSISFLEEAVNNINPKYKEGKFKETGAPYDALYYLANGYRINNQLDKAIETYSLFKKNLDAEVYDSVIVNMQIQSCLNAKEIISNPIYIKEKNLGNLINESNSEFNPVISDDEKILVFSKSEAFYDAILFSTKTDGKWAGPINLNEMLQVDRDLFPTSLSKDGKTLYLYSSAEYDGIIYTSRFENNIWSPIIKLNDNINTKFWESHATVSHDNRKLYFTSNRKGTIGGLDIYVSRRDTIGDWGPAENLGPVINTPYNEESPFLGEDDKTLFFSSRGHFNMGGYDVFYSTLLSDNNWSVPLNVGYPLNTTDDDVFFNPLNKGYEGYYAKESQGGYGKQDIYRIEIFSDDHPRKFFVRGMVKVADLLSNINDSVKISAMNIKNPAQTVIVYSNPETGEYEFQLPQGNYQITYQAVGSEKTTKNLELLLTNPSDSFVLPGTILPRTDFIAELSLESNKTISVTTGDSILFPIIAEPNSILRIEHWVGDSLISVEQFKITDSPFNYKMVPKPGDNKVVFILTDKFNNTTTTEVFITRQKDLNRQTLIRPEYSRVIAKKQIAAFTALLINRADNKLKKVIEDANVEKQQFGNVDEVIAYLKEEAAKQSISPEELDKLALKVAVYDNVLTQAAVDLVARYSEGDLKKLLEDLDIYRENLKTWTDLQEYIESKTGGKIKPEDLNQLAAAILTDIDPAIAIIKDKIHTYSNNSDDSSLIRQSVTSVDQRNIKTREKWLQAFYNQTINQGYTDSKISDLLVTISAKPKTDVNQFLGDLSGQADEPLKSTLKSLDLKKEKIRTPEELLLFLITNIDKAKYPEETVFKAIANLITINDIKAETIKKQLSSGGNAYLWILWIIIGSGLIFIFFLFWKRRNKNKE